MFIKDPGRLIVCALGHYSSHLRVPLWKFRVRTHGRNGCPGMLYQLEEQE